MMGIGEGEGEGKTKEAARNAISSPLLDGSIKGARKVIMNITGGADLTLEEVTAAASLIREAVSDRADIIFGTAIRDGMAEGAPDRDRDRLRRFATRAKTKRALRCRASRCSPSSSRRSASEATTSTSRRTFAALRRGAKRKPRDCRGARSRPSRSRSADEIGSGDSEAPVGRLVPPLRGRTMMRKD